MILCSHNTTTFANPINFVGWLGLPFAKCQRKDIEEQYNKGVRCFDIRIRFTPNGFPILAHGLYEIDKFFYEILYDLERLARKDKIYVRLILESKNPKDAVEEQRFYDFCKRAIEEYPSIVFWGGNRKGDWKQVYNFDFKPNFIQYVSSMAKDTPNAVKPRWYERFIPYFYAKRCNDKNAQNKHAENDIVAFDFI